MPFWVYMLHCRDRTIYTGHTEDLEVRLAQHEQGVLGGSYTAAKRPVRLIWSHQFPTRYEALAAERQIKGWRKEKKLALVREDWGKISALARSKKERPSTSSGRTALGYLHPHLSALPSEPFTLEAWARLIDTRLRFGFQLKGPIDLLALPPPTTPARRDELWRHTCFEAFVKDGAGAGYLELNLSPSGEWALYHFDDRRTGMKNPPVNAPAFRCVRSCRALKLRASIVLPDHAGNHLNLTAVIEEKSGTKSYWALAHSPEGPPDFHDPACFVLSLPPAEPSLPSRA